MAQRINIEEVQEPTRLVRLLNAMQTEIDALRILAVELKTDLSEHTHGGVTAGAGTTAAGATIAAADVAQQTKKSL